RRACRSATPRRRRGRGSRAPSLVSLSHSPPGRTRDPLIRRDGGRGAPASGSARAGSQPGEAVGLRAIPAARARPGSHRLGRAGIGARARDRDGPKPPNSIPGAAGALADARCTGPLAAQRVVAVPSPGPGPARFDQVYVDEVGPADAKRVLVLMPGTDGGAGDFALIAREIVRRVPGLAVWSIDRRSQALEDTSVFARLEAGQVTLQQAFDYYLGWITTGSPADHFQFLDPSTVPFAREWGMKTALDDARQVVLLARRGGRHVVLGGHSLGASLAAAYAAWDFDGRPGYKDLDGLVLIDGGLLGTFDAYDLAQAKQAIADLQTSNPFADPLGLGVPEAGGLFAEIAGYYARLAPAASAATLQSFPLLPASYNPPFPVTNRALLGFAFDRDTSPLEADLHVNAGSLAAAGTPRDWVDGGLTPVANLAQLFGHEPANA